MVIITAYFSNEAKPFSQKNFAISDWYSKPAILHSLCCKLGCLFITASNRGCRQFLPKWSKSFPVHNIEFIDYKENLPWAIIEFNNVANLEFSNETNTYNC